MKEVYGRLGAKLGPDSHQSPNSKRTFTKLGFLTSSVAQLLQLLETLVLFLTHWLEITNLASNCIPVEEHIKYSLDLDNCSKYKLFSTTSVIEEE